MIIDYIGTGGAEGVPALFCRCDVCSRARRERGREVRLRSAVCVNKNILVDFPPDIHTADVQGYVSLPDVRNILLTHSHADHCDMQELMYRAEPNFCRYDEDLTLNVYGNDKCEYKYLSACAENGGGINHTCFYRVKPFQTLELDGVRATVLPANHAPGEQAVMYLFEQDGKRFLYAEDTGSFPEETMEYLRGIYCCCISVDCAFCFGNPDGSNGHLGFNALLEHKRRLTVQGTADRSTIFIGQHFSHNGLFMDGRALSFEELEAEMGSYGVVMAYDGLSVTI